MLINIILILVIAAVVVLSVRSLIKGGGSCSGNCSGCSSGCSSGVDRKTVEETRRKMKMLSSEAVAVCSRYSECVNFEQTDTFMIGFIKDHEILGTQISSAGLGGTAEKIDLLRRCRVRTVICRGIGSGALHRLEKAGISCMVVEENSAKKAMQAAA